MSSSQQLLLGEGAGGSIPNYIEDVFSTYLYTGNGGTQTITNGIDLSTKGGLVWAKSRAAGSHFLYDTTRGVNKYLMSNATDSQTTQADSLTAFNTTGFSIGNALFNDNAVNYASWTFREQPKFFDVVTVSYSGTAITVNHGLGSVPGCIIMKLTTGTANWMVYHRSVTGVDSTGALNTTVGFASPNGYSNFASSINSTSFTFDAGFTSGTYVAYLFAHDAGGFGLTGTDNVISCGSYTGTAGVTTVNVGFEPQWLMIKKTNATANWKIVDNMRGFTAGPESTGTYSNVLVPNLSDAEAANSTLYTTSTGFNVGNYSSEGGAGNTFIYIAIRRGPMKVPTLGTSVYNAIARAGTGAVATVTGVGFTPDLILPKARNLAVNAATYDRLRGSGKSLNTTSTADEATYTNSLTSFDMDGMTLGSDGTSNEINYGASGTTYINYFFQRAPNFFDEVCYTGTGANTTQAHNLGVVPTLMIVKSRSATANWNVYAAPIWQGSGNFNVLTLNSTSPDGTFNNTIFNSTAPTASVFSIGSVAGTVNDSGTTYVAYLFATCPGVSKVGSYNGNGTTQTIDCGFTGGARFVLIKRTDASGPWYVYDTARGMTVLTDPYLLLNSPAAEVPTLGSVTTVSTGFAVDNTVLAGINAASPAAYIFFAVS